MADPKIQTPVTLGTTLTPYTKNANDLVEQANRAVINDQGTFDTAVDFIKICNSNSTKAEEARKSLTKPLNNHVKWINAQFKPITDQIDQAKRIMNNKTTAYQKTERERLEREAEEERKRQEETALEEAEAAQERGDSATSDAILDVASNTPAPQEIKPVGRGGLTGASGGLKDNWNGTVASIKDICAAVVKGDLPESIIREISKSGMNEIARNRKEEGVFHGIKIANDQTTHVR